jgi:outer membrane protein OmpA-like peptidoglycan-associated protein
LFSGEMSSFLSGGLNRLEDVLGSNATTLIPSIASFAGIKSSAVQGLMGIVASLGLGVLGRHARENTLSAQELRSYMSSQRSSIMSAMPAGFSLDTVFSDRDREERAAIIDEDNISRSRHMETVPERKKASLVPLLLLGLGIIALLWFLTRRTGENENAVATTTNQAPITATATDTHAARATIPTDYTDGRERTNVRLANGQEINAFRGGVEDQLVTCLNETSCAAGKDQWYNFDNINFEMGSAQLTAASQPQVQNIATILNAYPNAKIKIGGYTDKTGDATANKQLSQQRAEAVKNAIIAAGAKSGQIVGAEGYGSEFAKVDAGASDEERRTDRRIAVQLRDK